jgi:predicted O-methyltransferase YrrM
MIEKLIRLVGWLILLKEKAALSRLARTSADTSALSRTIDQNKLREIFASPDLDREWPEVAREIASFSIPESAGGVNAGDQRAIYYLIRYLRAGSVLEVGTHIGASTVHAIAAARKNRLEDPGRSGRLTTVDICDVNDPGRRLWLKWGSKFAPRDMAVKMGAASWVTFAAKPSLEYFSTCDEKYDFIFLDGDHGATTVHQEIPAALGRLNQGGVILLHDYFPNARPLWPRELTIPGPWLATQRFKSEGLKFRVLPLGELPWPAKRNTKLTSLALLVGE